MRGWPGWSPTSAARMAFRLEFSAEAERDFGLIFDHLLRSYLEFGESSESALDHAEARMAETRVAANTPAEPTGALGRRRSCH